MPLMALAGRDRRNGCARAPPGGAAATKHARMHVLLIQESHGVEAPAVGGGGIKGSLVRPQAMAQLAQPPSVGSLLDTGER
jgi:hypothetical protein